MDEPYRMILVDDEDEVRGRILSKISPDSGFTVVGTAGNGYDALQLIESRSPHVVLTDIKMPYIDGIELAGIVRRDFPTVRVAFITGYDEFDYAREAVELRVSSYLTKPVTQEDISRFLTRLKHELDEEFKENYNIETLRRRYEESLPLIIENYFTSSLISSTTGRDSDLENLKLYGVSLDETDYLLAFVTTERSEHLADVIEFEKLKLSVKSILKSILERHELESYSFMFHDGIVVIVKERGNQFDRYVDQVFYEMVRMAEKFLSARIDIGVSRKHHTFRNLRSAFHEAEIALENSKFLNTGRIVYIDQLDDQRPQAVSLKEPELRDLEYLLRYGSDEELSERIQELRTAAHKETGTIISYRFYMISLVNLIATYADSIQVNLQEIIEGDILERLASFRDLDQVLDWVLSTILQIRRLNVSTKMNNALRYLDTAMTYIRSHFQDPGLSMEQVCDELGISVSYLSLLFKRHKETTFVKFLTRVRMEKAQELLRYTGDRIAEVAGACGYRDVYYFSHSFKEYMGVSPKRFREDIHS